MGRHEQAPEEAQARSHEGLRRLQGEQPYGRPRGLHAVLQLRAACSLNRIRDPTLDKLTNADPNPNVRTRRRVRLQSIRRMGRMLTLFATLALISTLNLTLTHGVPQPTLSPIQIEELDAQHEKLYHEMLKYTAAEDVQGMRDAYLSWTKLDNKNKRKKISVLRAKLRSFETTCEMAVKEDQMPNPNLAPGCNPDPD